LLLHEFGLDREFLLLLAWWDGEIARVVAIAGCRRCSGPLHQANYQRKPRGGWLFEVLDALTLRHALCCGHCRRRSLPPSVLFLGRRVYIEAVVVLACAAREVAGSAQDLADTTGVPSLTLRRWTAWWRDTLPTLPAWSVLRARFASPPPEEAALPSSLLLRITESIGAHTPTTASPSAVMLMVARCLSPLTTRLMDAATFVREVSAQIASKDLAQKMMVPIGALIP